MPLLSLARALAALISAAVLAGAAYLLWRWFEGAWVRDIEGALVHVREPWLLAAGLALLVWSFAGRWLVPLVLARGGGRPTAPTRGEGKTVDGDTGSLLYVEDLGAPRAPVLILTHGWGMDSTFWNQACEDLGDRFRIVRWDLPGLGRSRVARGKVSLDAFATDLAGLLRPLDRPAVLVGHSIGGMTIQTLLRNHPDVRDRIAGVALLNTTYTNPVRTMIASRLLLVLQKPVIEPMMRLTILLWPLVWLSKWQSYLSGSTHAALRLGFGTRPTRRQLEHAARLSTKAPPAVEAKGDLAMLHWDATGALAEADVPALIMGGQLDIVTKPDASRSLGTAPGAAVTILPGANHMGPLEQATVYNAAIAAFALNLQPVSNLAPAN